MKQVRSAGSCESLEGRVLPRGVCGQLDFNGGDRIEYAIVEDGPPRVLLMRVQSKLECGTQGCSTSVFVGKPADAAKADLALVSLGQIFRCRLQGRSGISITSDEVHWTCFSIQGRK